jgi:hypothetical protein
MKWIMESITIYPENEKQKTLLKYLLEEMKIRFEMVKTDDNPLLSEEDYYAKIDKSIKEADSGKTKILPKDKQKEFLGL